MPVSAWPRQFYHGPTTAIIGGGEEAGVTITAAKVGQQPREDEEQEQGLRAGEWLGARAGAGAAAVGWG